MSEPISDSELEEIVGLESVATPGPWMWDGDHDDPYIGSDSGTILPVDVDWFLANHDQAQADAVFMAAAREAVPKMAARIAEMEQSFDMWYKAEMRGIAMWRDANPGNELRLPSTARHTFWLITEIERLSTEKAGSPEGPAPDTKNGHDGGIG